MVQWPTAESRKPLLKHPFNTDLFFFNLFQMNYSTSLSEFWILLSDTLCIIRHIDCSDSFCATSAHNRAHGLCFSVYKRSLRK